MKRISIVLAVLPFFVFTQNYQTIQPDIEIHFESVGDIIIPMGFISADNHYPFGPTETVALRALQITLSGSKKDGVYYKNHSETHDNNYSNFHFFDDCVSPSKLSWIGNDVFLREDGYNIFFNRQHDSIFINTQAQQDESFVFYNFPDGSYFLATISDHNFLSFLDISDSAKTISLQFYNSDNQPEFSPLNEKEIIITKNYGFYKTLNFRDFPDFGEETFQVTEHILYGHENIDSSFRKLKFRDIYDFEIGDKYHYSTNYKSDDYSWYKKKTWDILDKEWINTDVVQYTLREERWGYEGPIPYYDLYHFIDTITVTYSDLDSVISSELPFEPRFYSNAPNERTSFNIIRTNNYNNRPALCITDNGYEQYQGDTCYYRWWFDSGYLNSEVFVKGCGLLENSYTWDGDYEYSYYSNLNYYKKGEDEWGTELEPPTTGITENSGINRLISVYPNPADNSINFNITENISHDNYNLIIFDAQGKIQLEQNINGAYISIDVSCWPEGLYFYVLSGANITEKGKVVIRH